MAAVDPDLKTHTDFAPPAHSKRRSSWSGSTPRRGGKLLSNLAARSAR